ncbi:hypothetical protein [Paenisporosarcina cavernae]|uniref:Uncharacterized protein n=1 Tax=Paenisporosarcina cavernae TaxID=2320858 RepID=A0A385YQG1_9BACL|nr:hypothetical protein [Paenisporosarcina cavernae]AYC28965.1 hypothetical protein D3873_03415 [Paenisporosarcina cavernae]
MGLLGEILFAVFKEVDKSHNGGKLTKKLNQEMKKRKVEVKKEKEHIHKNINMYAGFLENKSNDELLAIYRDQSNNNEKRYAAGNILKQRGYTN